MQVYRFIPNTTDYELLGRPLQQRWWPDGIDLGWAMDLMFDEVRPVATDSSPVLDYFHEADGGPVADFPALALNLPVLSRKAVRVLKAGGIEQGTIPVSVSGIPHFAVQPVAIASVLDWRHSKGRSGSDGDTVYLTFRAFDEARIVNGFFTIADFVCSDVYLNDRTLRLCRDHGLSGMEHVELVYDDGPVVPTYQQAATTREDWFRPRARLEKELLTWRCLALNMTAFEVDALFEELVAQGLIGLADRPNQTVPAATK